MNNPKPRGKCFHCGIKGNWKRNCPNYLAQKMNSDVTESIVIEVSFIVGTSDFWDLDFGTMNHIYNTLQRFQKNMKLSDGDVTLHLGLEVRVVEVSVRVVKLFFFFE